MRLFLIVTLILIITLLNSRVRKESFKNTLSFFQDVN